MQLWRAPHGWLLLVGFAGLLATGSVIPRAAAQAFPDRLAALDAQFARAAGDRTRQVSLVDDRLQTTRSKRLAGRNANASSLALRFTNAPSETGTADRNAVFQTKNHIASETERRTRRYAVWFGGDVTLDARRALDPRAATVFSNGIAFGADARVNSRLLVGNAVGVAFDEVGVGAEASQRSRYFSDTLYGSVFTAADTYLDMALGGSLTDFTSRYDTATGERRAGQLFGALRYSRSFRHGGLAIRPYGEATASFTTLDGYSEDGSAGLACAPQARRAFDFGLGLRTETTIAGPTGQIRPFADLRMTRTTSRRSGTVLSAHSGTAGSQTIAAAHSATAGFAASAGIDWSISKTASFGTLYGVSASDSDPVPRQTVSARFTLRF